MSDENPPTPLSPDVAVWREAEIARFLRRQYGLRGTLRLHRAALGADLLRAPLNVMLSPVFLLMKLLQKLLGLCGLERASHWLGTRRIFLKSDVSRHLEGELEALFARLDAGNAAPAASPAQIRAAISSYTETRNAVAEITTSILVIVAGFTLLHRATPGVVSLAGPVAHLRAQAQSIQDFALGSWLGGVWYGFFPAQFSVTELVLTGLVLTIIASVVTTFAGVLADPVQLYTGIHRRRLRRMMARLDRGNAPPALEREHIFARIADIGDVLGTLWRSLR